MQSVQVPEFGGPDVLQINEVQKPSPKSNEMLVKVHSAGVNPVEVYLREGNPRYPKAATPFMLGTDFAGVVEETSEDFSDSKYKKGTKVFGILTTKKGTYCEYITVNPETEIVGVMPENCTFEQGAAFGVPFLTAYQGLVFTAKVKPGQIVLVHGASGGVGIAAIQVACAYGAKVIATAGTEVGMNNCKTAGASMVFNHYSEGYAQKMKNAAEKEYGGIDIIFENVAHNNMDKDFEVVKKGGFIIIVGAKEPVMSDIPTIFYKELTVQGARGFSMTPENRKFLVKDFQLHTKSMQNRLNYKQEKFSSGAYSPITYSFPMKEVVSAHKEIITPKSGGAQGKVVITM